MYDLMYDVVIDVDGVLLDIHTSLSQYLNDQGFQYSVKDVYTYDFNRSLPDTSSPTNKFNTLPPLHAINNAFADPMLYKNAPINSEAILYIRRCAEIYPWLTFAIYTLSPNEDVKRAKQILYDKWFCGIPNIKLISTLDSSKPPLMAKTVIEDCHCNLRKYNNSTYRYLVNTHYNQKKYNPKYNDVFTHPRFMRCKNTLQAVELAIAKAIYLRHTVSY